MTTSVISLRLEDNLKSKLEEIGKLLDRTPHSLMKKAIERFVQEHDEEQLWFESRVQAMEEDLKNGDLVPMEKALEMLKAS